MKKKKRMKESIRHGRQRGVRFIGGTVGAKEVQEEGANNATATGTSEQKR